MDSQSGVFQIFDTALEFSNYTIYIDAFNEFGNKGGSENYLIDVTLLAIPIFLDNLTKMSALIYKN